MKKILYGVCGIGNGHTYRQLPTLSYLAQTHKIMIFAYGDSLKFFLAYFAEHANVRVVEVAAPYYVGDKTGIDFAATAKRALDSGINYTAVNNQALNEARKYLGKTDLVISDYEPISAQYAYTYNVPLVTIDQQSKYLSGDFPTQLNGQGYIDEVERLRLFFPKAAARIACSFFRVPQHHGTEKVLLYPPVLRDEVKAMGGKLATRNPKEVLVYLTAQDGFGQKPAQIVELLISQPAMHFQVFIPKTADGTTIKVSKNVSLYQHGDQDFTKILSSCAGMATTAGHGLLSEAMYLGIPVLALPLPLYEQQMNAHVIEANGFGMSAPALSPETLSRFARNLPQFARAIKKDQRILLRGDGQQEIKTFLEQNFL